MKRISGKVQAVVNMDGILAFIHPESGEGADTPGKPSAATLWFGGNTSEKKELWLQASPLSHPFPGTAPFLFINSSQPPVLCERHPKLCSYRVYAVKCLVGIINVVENMK